MKEFSAAYKKTVIYYFSGTGNARFAAEEIARLAGERGVDSKVVKLVDEIPDTAGTDKNTLIGFCYPTHGFNTPPVVIKYISKFPGGKSDVFLLNTRAGMKLFKVQTPGLGGLALWVPALILKLKGYRLRGFRPLDMPSNWISLHPGLTGSAVAFIAEKCRITLEKFTDKILGKKRVLSGLAWLPLDILVFPVAIGYYVFGRFALAKTFYADHTCTGCGICINGCPVAGVVWKSSRPYWTFRCESCMKCMNSCPGRSIQTAHGFTFFLWWLLFSFIPYSIAEFLIGMNIMTVAFYDRYFNLVYYLLMMSSGFALLFAGYAILHQLLRVKWINRIFTFTSLTRFKFWRRYTYPRKNGGL